MSLNEILSDIPHEVIITKKIHFSDGDTNPGFTVK